MYKLKPLIIVDGIPVFSERDAYIKNYEKIAVDHLAAAAETGKNPFMSPSQIQDAESDTRSMICSFVTPGGRILDAGVGLGRLLKPLSDFQRYGVDVALPYLKEAKKRGIDVAMAKLEELPYQDEYFEAIVVCDVLEHVFMLDQVTTQLLRTLKSKGILIVRVPNNEDLSSYLTDAQQYAHSHVRRFDLNSIRLYLEKCFGLQYLSHKYTGYDFGTFTQLINPPPRSDGRIHSVIKSIRKAIPEVDVFRKLTTPSLEEVVDALIGLRDKYPDIYSVVAPELINPLGLIAVFRKH